MWTKYIRDLILTETVVGVELIFNKYSIKKVARDITKNEDTDTFYQIYLFKKYLKDMYLVDSIKYECIYSMISNIAFLNFHRYKYNLYSDLSKLYYNHTTKHFQKKITKLNKIVFDIKKKQLYSSIFSNTFQKKLITNGILLKELKILVKNKKKHIETSGQNIKKIIKTYIKKRKYAIIIKGMKHQILKIIRFIKKYYNESTLFVFTPKMNLFGSKFKKIKSIKRKLTKRYTKFI